MMTTTLEQLNEESTVARVAHPQGQKATFSKALSKRNFFAPVDPGVATTTKQGQVLTTAAVAPPTSHRGIAIGRDMLSRQLVAHDPFQAYEEKRLTSPAVVVLGMVGKGKSSLLKCGALRLLATDHRRVVVIDKKDRGGVGEYAQLADVMGSTPLRFTTGTDSKVLNPLDPAITNASDDDPFAGARILTTLAELAGDRALIARERHALRRAFLGAMDLAQAKQRQPVVNDVMNILRSADAVLKGEDSMTVRGKDDYVASAREVYYAFDELVGAYPHMFDNETSKDLELDARFTSFDISQLPEQGPAVPAVVALANMWLLGVTKRDPRPIGTSLIIEEGWHIAKGPNASLIRDNVKLARARGISLVMALHTVSDIPTDSPGYELLRQAETRYMYQQQTDADIEAIHALYKLQPGSLEALREMPQGQMLLKIGNDREIWVEHLRSPLEIQITETDAAMHLGAANE